MTAPTTPTTDTRVAAVAAPQVASMMGAPAGLFDPNVPKATYEVPDSSVKPGDVLLQPYDASRPRRRPGR